jgi:uncharacterized GH25 family protein
MKMKKALLIFALSACAWGHDFWLKPASPNRVVLEYGHEGSSDKYSPSVVKKATALNARGAPVKVAVAQDGERCVLSGDPEAVQVAAEVDTGYWTKTVHGWANKSKRESGSYLLSEWSLYYSKALLKPAASLNQPFGHRLEFVSTSVDEKAVRVRLLLNGQPLGGKAVYSQHEKLGETDSKGELSVGRNGLTVMSASHKEPIQNNPDADRLHLHAVLTL